MEIELDPSRLTEKEKEEVREQIQRFHTYYELIQNSRYYRLSAPSLEQDYVTWEFAAPDQGEALLNVVVTHPRANPGSIHVRLKGMNPDALYQVRAAHYGGCPVPEPDTIGERTRTFSGSSLMYAGYTVPLRFGDFPSVQIHFVRLEQEG